MQTNSGATPGSHPPVFAAELAELLPSAIGVIDLQGFILWANAACRELIGWDPATQPRVHVSNIIDTEMYGLANEIQHRMSLAPQIDMKIAARMRRLDKTVFDASVHARAVQFGPDRTTGLLTIVTTSEASPQADPIHRAMDLQRELVCEWARDGRILFCNRAYRDYLHNGEDMVGRNIDEFVHWTKGNSREELIGYLLAGVPAYVNTGTYSDGRSIEWSNTLVQSSGGDMISVLAVGRDVTERLRAEKAVRKNEERFRTMVTYIWDAIMLVDRDGNLLDATSFHRTDLGYPPEFWAQNTLVDIVHPDDQERALLELAALVEAGPMAETWFELRARRSNGAYSWLELNGANLLDNPAVNAVLLTVRNVDRRKKIEAELTDRHAKAEAALRERSRFVAQVSHELRNPLHGMLGLSEILTKSELSPELAEAAQAIYRQSTTMRRIVDDLLDMAQLEVGALRIRLEDLDLDAVFHDAVETARDIAGPDVNLHSIDPAPELRYIRADNYRLHQAIGNLLSNACKNTERGEVRITASAGEQHRSVRISVLDSGSGIEINDVARLFQPYERGTDATDGGVGLGLAIAKGTVEAMGGCVGAVPRPEGGSCFWFELPLADPETASAGRTTDIIPLAGLARFAVDVLVVDDDPVNLLLARLQLADVATSATTASGGEEAWALLQAQPFDAAFIDVQMPGMSGLELVQLIRAMPAPHPLIVVMTASATAADREAALAAGADHFVAKPATSADIRAALRMRFDEID
jgi:PAS domain S-box-containing protein